MSEATEAKKEKEVEKITMSDGRIVEFAGKRRMRKEKIVERDAEGKVTKLGVRIDFRNGVTNFFPVPEHQFYDSAAHGYTQKLGDKIASLKNEDGSPASEDDMYLAIEELHERLAAPGASWNEVEEGGGFGGASILMKALVEWSGQTIEQVKAYLKPKSQVEKLKLRDSTLKAGKTGLTIKQIVERMEAEKKAKGPVINEEELLAGLPQAA